MAIGSLASPPSDHVGAQALAELGLQRKGAYYCLRSEIEFSKKITALRKIEQRLRKARKQYARFDGDRRQAHEAARSYRAEWRRVNARMMHANDVREHNRLIATMNELNLRIAEIDAILHGSDNPHEIVVAKHRKEFVDAVAESKSLKAKTDAGYHNISHSDVAKKSLDALNATSKRTYRLGPRPKYATDCEKFAGQADVIETRTIQMRNQNGVWWVDVKLNGSVTKPFVFDTGASMVSLPSRYAAEIGLQPDEDDPRITLRVADGRTVEAFQMLLGSVQLGNFTVEDVICSVEPPEADAAPPLLGGSFLRHFVYQIDPAAGVLTLTRLKK
jgi:clan AA aspartic protease (TIGR02281 family)